jgi:hypothetical protein
MPNKGTTKDGNKIEDAPTLSLRRVRSGGTVFFDIFVL